MKKWIVLILLGGLTLPSISSAIDLKQSKFTQVVNNVEIISAADKSRHTASVNDIFSMPDVLRTGPNSRAELSAVDGTITRVGANTIFQFDPLNRTIDLQQGSLLFHSPKGKGGGTIRTGSATASVIGTTIIVTATPNGGFKLLDLEGQAEVRFLSGLTQTLEPGQMTFVLPSGQTSPVLVFRLDSETKNSTLVGGFSTPLDSQSKIDAEITQQLLQILNGTAADTGFIVGQNATPTTIQVVQSIYNRPSPTPPAPDGDVIGKDRVSNLPVNYSPLDPNQLQSGRFNVPSGVYQHPNTLLPVGLEDRTPSSGFVGNNINIDTAKVDLSSFAGKSDFDFVANNNLTVWQSLNLTPGYTPVIIAPVVDTTPAPTQPGAINLIAGSQMWIADGATLEADTGVFGLVAGSFNNFNPSSGAPNTATPNDTLVGVNIVNQAGVVGLLSSSDFTFESGSIYGSISASSEGSSEEILPTGGEVEIESFGNLTLGSESTSEPTVSNVGRYDVSIYSGGNIDLLANGNLDIYDSLVKVGGGYQYSDASDISYLDASGDINITAGADIDISGSDIEAYGSGSALGNVTITGTGVVAMDAYIYGDGDVSVTATGDDVEIDDGYLSAGGYVVTSGAGSDATSTLVGGNVNIEANGIAGIYDNSEIDTDAGVGITSDGSDVDIYDSSIYAGDSDFGGSVYLTALNGNINIIDSDIEAYSGNFGCGNVTITGGGNVSIYDYSTIYADGNVDIESGATLTVGEDPAFDVTITAGSDATLSAVGDVDVTDTSISASDVYITSTGSVSLSSGGSDATVSSRGGNVDVEYSDVEGYDSATASALGNVTVNGSTINAGDPDGEINIVGDGDASGDQFNGAGSVTISAGEKASITGSDIYLNGDISISGSSTSFASGSGDLWIDTGGSFSLTAGCLAVNGSTIQGDNINISDSSLSTIGGDIDIYNDGNFYSSVCGSVKIKDGSTVDINDIYLDDVAITASSSDDVGGNVNIVNDGSFYAYNGGCYYVSCDSTVDINSISIADGSEITANEGDVTVSASDSVYIDSSDISANGYISYSVDGTDTIATPAGGNVTISGGGDVGIFDDSTIDAGGNVSITSSSSTVSTQGDSSSDGGGDVTVSSSTINAGYESSFGGNITVNAENGNVNINDSYLSANESDSVGGSVNIMAGGNIDIDGSTIDADGTVTVGAGGYVSVYDSLSSSDLCIGGWDVTAGTYVSLEADDNLSIYGSTLTASDGNVTASADDGMLTIDGGYDYTASGDPETSDSGYYQISASGTASLSGDCVSIKDATIYGGDEVDITGTDGNVKVKDADIVTDDGDVNIVAEFGALSLAAGCADYGVNIDAGGAVNLSADNDVCISDATITAEDGDLIISGGAAISESSDDTDASGGVYIGDASTLISYNGDVKITSSGSCEDVTVDDSTIKASDGDIKLTAPDGEVDVLDGSELSAGGDVKIWGSYSVDVDDSELKAWGEGSDLKISSDGDVSIEDGSTLKSGGDIKIWGDESVDISDSTLKTWGDGSEIKISSEGNICIDDSYLSSKNGNVTVYANDGMLTINAGYDYSTAPEVAGDYDINASGTASLSGDCVSIKDTTIYGGDEVDITGTDGNVKVKDADIVTDDGDVDVVADYGSLKLEEGCADYGVNIDAGGAVNLSADGTVSISDSSITAEAGCVNIESGFLESASDSTGQLDVSDTSDNGTVELFSGNSISASGNVFLTSDNLDVDIDGSTEITAAGGEISINAAYGNVNIDSSYLYAGSSHDVNISGDSAVSATGGVNITAGGGDFEVSSGTWEGSYDGTTYYTYPVGGEVTINSTTLDLGGNVSICGTDITSGICDNSGDVDINSSGTASIYGADGLNIQNSEVSGSDISIKNSDITANNGDVNIVDSADISITTDGSAWLYEDTVDVGNITICDADITATSDGSTGGNISITSDGSIDVSYSYSSDISLDNISISSSTLDAAGSITITAAGNVDICGSDLIFNGGGDVNDSGYSTSQNGSIEIGTSAGNLAITAGGEVSLQNSILDPGGNIAITDNSDITVINGDVNVGTAAINIYGGCLSISDVTVEGGNVTVSDSKITAAGGNVNIGGYDDIYFNDSLVEHGYTVEAGNVSISDSDIFAFNGNVTINSGGTVTVQGNAGDYQISGNNVAISANGEVDLFDADIEAGNSGDDSLNISAGGTLNIVDDQDFSGSTMVSGYNVTLTGDEGVYLGWCSGIGANATIEANGGWVLIESADGGIYGNNLTVAANEVPNVGSDFLPNNNYVDVYADYGNVDVENSTITASVGSVDIEAGYDEDSSFASETLTLNNDSITAGGSVTLDAQGTITIDANSTSETISGCDVTVESFNGDVNIGIGEAADVPSLTATSGDVDVWADYGNTDVENATITALNGVVDIEGGYDDEGLTTTETLTLVGDTITAGSDVYLESNGNVDIDTTSVTGSSVTVESYYTGDVNIGIGGQTFDSPSLTATTDDLDIYGEYGAVDIENATLTATLGNVDIEAGSDDSSGYETLTLNNDSITAGGMVILDGNGNIAIDADSTGETINGSCVTIEALHDGAVNIGISGETGDSPSITASTGNLYVYADYGNVDVENSTIAATDGDVDIEAGQQEDSASSETLTMVNDTVTSPDTITLGAPATVSVTGGSIGGSSTGTVSINAGSDITIDGASVSADDIGEAGAAPDPVVSGHINLTSTSGTTTVKDGASLTSYYLSINSSGGILIDGTTKAVSLTGTQMDLAAANGDVNGGSTISVCSADLSSFTTVNMAAHTINLDNVTFGGTSIVNLGSYYGIANVRVLDINNVLPGVIPGDVNFHNVNYGLIPIISSLQIGTGIGTTSGIYVHAN